MKNKITENNELIILNEGVDIAGNKVKDLNEDSCDNFVVYAPTVINTVDSGEEK